MKISNKFLTALMPAVKAFSAFRAMFSTPSAVVSVTAAEFVKFCKEASLCDSVRVSAFRAAACGAASGFCGDSAAVAAPDTTSAEVSDSRTTFEAPAAMFSEPATAFRPSTTEFFDKIIEQPRQTVFVNFCKAVLCGAAIAFCTSPVFAAETYNIITLSDSKTEKPVYETVIGQNASAEISSAWRNDLRTPFNAKITVKSGGAEFLYLSPSVFVENITKKQISNNKPDVVAGVEEKTFEPPEEYVAEFLPKNAVNVVKTKERTFSEDTKNHLMELMYDKYEELAFKADSSSIKTTVEDFDVMPYFATFSYEIRGEKYKSAFITMISFFELNFEYKSGTRYTENVRKILWKNHGMYVMTAKEADFAKNIDDFSIFVANTKMIARAQDALYKTVLQNRLNKYSSNETKIYKSPSELFAEYYDVYAFDVSEYAPAISLDDITLAIKKAVSMKDFEYRKFWRLYPVRVSVPEKYSFVYYLPKSKTLVFSEKEEKKLGKKLKKFEPINPNGKKDKKNKD